jgi:hypothetical protein
MILTYETLKLGNNGRITPHVKNTSCTNKIPKNNIVPKNNLDNIISTKFNTNTVTPTIKLSNVEKIPIVVSSNNSLLDSKNINRISIPTSQDTESVNIKKMIDINYVNDVKHIPLVNDVKHIPVVNDVKHIPLINDVKHIPVVNDVKHIPIVNNTTEKELNKDKPNFPEIYYINPYNNKSLKDISNDSFSTFTKYCENIFIHEDEISQMLPRGKNTIKKKLNMNILDKFILVVDFNNAGGGTSFFIESIISKYKKYQTLVIVRNNSSNIYFTVNDEYNFEDLYNDTTAYQLLLNNVHKIEKIFVNHTMHHTQNFINSLFNLKVKIDLITHDFISIFGVWPNLFNDTDYYLDGNTKKYYIDINRYDNIITQNKGNIYIYNNFIEDKQKIIISSLPDYNKSNKLIKTNNNNIVIGIIGHISECKGLAVLKKIINFYSNTNIKFIVFGSTSINLFNNCYEYKNINELNELLITHKPNILIELSIWPETYSYTLTLGMITQLPIIYLKKNNYCTIEDRLSNYNKAYSFTTIEEFNRLIYKVKQDYFYTIEPVIYFNDFWNNYFVTKKEKITLPVTTNNVYNINTFCIYFPQFHEIQENNISFYNKYTDITNLELISKSQKTVELLTPSRDEFNIKNIIDYDYIKNKQILQKQIDIIYDYNISGFAIYYYWFSKNTVTNKNMIMDNVINQFFDSSLDMKNRKVFFMWANESWSSNISFGNVESKIENEYSNIEHINNNINTLLQYFKNENYLKINNKPVFEIHHPWFMTQNEVDIYYEIFNKTCIENEFNGIHLIINSMNGKHEKYTNRMHHFNYKSKNKNYITYDNEKKHSLLDYKKYVNKHISYNCNNSIQTLVFDFDNRIRLFQPNRLTSSTVCINNTEIDKIICINKILENYKEHQMDNVDNILLINSWNEWGEKMAIEPCEEYGYYYLNLIKENLSKK